MNLVEDRRLRNEYFGFLLLDGTPAHNGLQGREAEHTRRKTLVIGAGRSDDGGSAVLDVDDDHVPHRPDLPSVGQFYWSEETELFFPIFSLLIPHQGPVGIKGGLVQVQQLSRIAVAWIFGCDLENVCVDHFPLFVQRQVITRLSRKRQMLLTDVGQDFLIAQVFVIEIGNFAVEAVDVIECKFTGSQGLAALGGGGAANSTNTR